MTDNELIQLIIKYENATDFEKRSLLDTIKQINDDQFGFLIKYKHLIYWWTQAEILIALGYPRVKPILHKLFEWLQDFNWPGALDLTEQLLLKLDKPVFIEQMTIALRRALIDMDTEWVYWLTTLADSYGLQQNDFTEEDNAYDIIMLDRDAYDEDGMSFSTILNTLLEWGYPRIRQFLPMILSSLSSRDSGQSEEQEVQCMAVIDLLPQEARECEIKKALAQLHYTGKLNSIGYLQKIVPIDDTEEALVSYFNT